MFKDTSSKAHGPQGPATGSQQTCPTTAATSHERLLEFNLMELNQNKSSLSITQATFQVPSSHMRPEAVEAVRTQSLPHCEAGQHPADSKHHPGFTEMKGREVRAMG